MPLDSQPRLPVELPPLSDPLADPARLAALAATGLLDSPPEESFDRLTRMASEFLRAPVALLTLVDDHRQFEKSCVAPDTWPTSREAPLADSYCKWTIIERQPVIIPDARLDPRVQQSAFLRDLGFISYLGIPLILSNGHVLGTLCVGDFRARAWTDREVRLMSDLAAYATTEMELRLDAVARRHLSALKDEFVSIVAHELRTPLTSIRGSLGLLASGQMTGTPQAQRLLDIAAQNSDRLVRLINDMLDLDRLQSGRLDLDLARVDVEDPVDQSFNAVQGAATAAQVELVRRVDPGLDVWADGDRVIQVLINLLSNAIKFSPAGGLVEVIAEARGEQALFQVRDRGRGIPSDKLDAIFERFRQVDSSDARDKGGTGLGLAICRSIVQQHGGRIWAASEWGAGSTFFFSLPREARPPGE